MYSTVFVLIFSLYSGLIQLHDKLSILDILSAELKRHPMSTVQDIYKFIHQASFGSEHAVKDTAAVQKWMDNELAYLDLSIDDEMIDFLSPKKDLVRINLRPYIKSGYNPQFLLKAFVKTANEYQGSTEQFNLFWKAVKELSESNQFEFSNEELDKYFLEKSQNGYPAVHHSKKYSKFYKPAYRVVNLNYLPFLLENNTE